MLLQKGHIFLVELLLQGFGGGGNDHAASAANRGNQVGQRFARSGARFHDRVMMLFEGLVNDLGHFQLARAMFVAADHAAFEQATGAKNIVHGGGHRRRAVERLWRYLLDRAQLTRALFPAHREPVVA